jgi:hypothetical protein
LVSELDKLILKIGDLIDAITKGLIPAIDAVPTKLIVKVGYEYDEYTPPDNSGGDGSEKPPPPGSGYAGGTHGRYVDFGAGTRVVLHGEERIVTKAEGRGGGGGLGAEAIVAELRALRQAQASQDVLLRRAVRDAVLLAR